MGYEAYREHRLRAAEGDGHRWPRAPSSRRSTRTPTRRATTASRGREVDRVRPWDTLSEDEKRLFARMAEVYAGFLSHADHELGRLLDYLEETRRARQHDHRARLRQRRLRRGRPERLGQREQVLQRRARTRSRRTSSTSTSSAARRPTTTTRPAGRGRSTPRSRCGSATPTTRAAPPTRSSSRGRTGITATRRAARQYTPRRSTSCRRMLRLPRHRDARRREGLHAAPARGRELRRAPSTTRRPTTGEGDAVLLDARHPGDLAQGLEGGDGRPGRARVVGRLPQQRWELFDTDADPSECHDLAAEQPR